MYHRNIEVGWPVPFLVDFNFPSACFVLHWSEYEMSDIDRMVTGNV